MKSATDKARAKRAGRSQKAAAARAASPNPINITSEEGKQLRECAAKTGQTVEQFVRKFTLEACAKLADDALTAIPCPFCNRTDMLIILRWTNERPDGTEYIGDAVKCERCDAIAAVESWARLGTDVVQMGGAA
jgi:hypothetical protein